MTKRSQLKTKISESSLLVFTLFYPKMGSSMFALTSSVRFKLSYRRVLDLCRFIVDLQMQISAILIVFQFLDFFA